MVLSLYLYLSARPALHVAAVAIPSEDVTRGNETSDTIEL